MDRQPLFPAPIRLATFATRSGPCRSPASSTGRSTSRAAPRPRARSGPRCPPPRARGPEIDYSAGLKLAADIAPAPGEPWWKVTAPLDLGVKMRLHAFTLNLESPRLTVWSEEPELLRATMPAGGSSIPDVDLHTWDQDGIHAYWNDQYAIDSGFLDQDVIPGYGPETFQETDPGHTFTFGVCHYSGEQANVTVDVRDPDGRTRRFAVTLRGRKAASLLTVSPDGADGYLPSSGWCDSGGTDPTAIGETTTGSFGD